MAEVQETAAEVAVNGDVEQNAVNGAPEAEKPAENGHSAENGHAAENGEATTEPEVPAVPEQAPAEEEKKDEDEEKKADEEPPKKVKKLANKDKTNRRSSSRITNLSSGTKLSSEITSDNLPKHC